MKSGSRLRRVCTARAQQSPPALRGASIARRDALLRLAPRPIVIAALVTALHLSACAKDPVRPLNDRIPGIGGVDFALAWSRDGQWIAFRRPVPSSYGPPGMYVVHRTGSIVRYVYGPADAFFPNRVSFSPDGHFLTAVYWHRLIVVNLTTLEVREPIHTLADVQSTDWSPDGRSILYSLFYSGNPATTLDSLGLFVLDVATGTSRPLRWGPDPVLSRHPRWSPDGRLIAMNELVIPDQALSIMNSDGTGHRFVIPPKNLKLYSRIDWYLRDGGARILFWNATPPPRIGPYLINPDGSGLIPFWHSMGPEGFLSPTGEEYVRAGLDPSTRLGVLYVGRVDDLTDLALRQITKYEPPAPTPAIRQGEARDVAVQERGSPTNQ